MMHFFYKVSNDGDVRNDSLQHNKCVGSLEADAGKSWPFCTFHHCLWWATDLHKKFGGRGRGQSI